MTYKVSRPKKPFSSIQVLVDAGAVSLGDVVTAKLDNRLYKASIGSDGTIVMAGVRYKNPSQAWAAVKETTTDRVSRAWEKWRHVASGKTLYELREELIADPPPPIPAIPGPESNIFNQWAIAPHDDGSGDSGLYHNVCSPDRALMRFDTTNIAAVMEYIESHTCTESDEHGYQ